MTRRWGAATCASASRKSWRPSNAGWPPCARCTTRRSPGPFCLLDGGQNDCLEVALGGFRRAVDQAPFQLLEVDLVAIQRLQTAEPEDRVDVQTRGRTGRRRL